MGIPLLLLLLICEISYMSAEKYTASQMVTRLLNENDYDNAEPPNLDKPTEVKLGLYINSFSAISEQTMEYTISFYLRLSWVDPRLAFDRDTLVRHNSKIHVEDSHIDRAWVPDVFFRNEKSSERHDVTVDNRMMQVKPDGDVWYVTKYTATLSCPMKLQAYPHDTQMCPIMFESFAYTMDTLYFAWLDSPLDIDAGVQLPQYRLEDTILYDCSQNYTAGAFPCLEMRFVLARDSGYYVLQFYIPTIVIVIMSWLSFWINVRVVETRFTYGIICMLIMMMCAWGSNSSLPRVSYVKAIDVWTLVCFLFLFAALVESAVVSFFSRRGKGKGGVDEGQDQGTSKIDILSTIIFSVCFLIFNIAYWVLYTARPE